MRRNRLLRVAGRAAAILGSRECVLVGGLAVGGHGYVRATSDVDFVFRGSLAEARRRLLEAGFEATLTKGDPLDGEFSCLKALVAGVRVDVLPALVEIDWDHPIEIALSPRRRLQVVDLEALLKLKLRAGGPKDLMDVAALVLRNPGYARRALDYAQTVRLKERLEGWLAEPRLRAEVLETAEDGLRRAARRRGRVAQR